MKCGLVAKRYGTEQKCSRKQRKVRFVESLGPEPDLTEWIEFEKLAGEKERNHSMWLEAWIQQFLLLGTVKNLGYCKGDARSEVRAQLTLNAHVIYAWFSNTLLNLVLSLPSEKKKFVCALWWTQISPFLDKASGSPHAPNLTSYSLYLIGGKASTCFKVITYNLRPPLLLTLWFQWILYQFEKLSLRRLNVAARCE